MSESILISVIMAVHNEAESYLKASIKSILNQTYKNIEFIIVDDCCENETRMVLDALSDERVLIIRNENNVGLTKSLNRAMDYCNGKYIARMDADDISYKRRLELQLNYMERNPEIGVLGCWTSSNINRKIKHWHGRASSEWRRVAMMFGNYGICHPTAFIRKSVLDENHIKYNEDFKKAQDYDFWIRLLGVTNMSVYSKALLMYRTHDMQISNSEFNSQFIYKEKIQRRYIEESLGLDAEEAEKIVLLSNGKLDAKSILEAFKKMESVVMDKKTSIFINNLKNEITRFCFEGKILNPTERCILLRSKYAIRGLLPVYWIWRINLFCKVKII